MKIGLIGNQNSGKTTLFNELTGMNAKIGNWPGVTIEKKSGFIKGTKHEIIDLPGIYSLSPYSIEEEVSRKFIFYEKPELIINVIDATSIERSLYLTTQLLELDCKVIIALNMVDLLEEKGLQINIERLKQRLGVKVLKISALKSMGISELIKAIDENYLGGKIKVFDDKIELISKEIISRLNNKLPNKKFIAINLLQEDERFKNYNTVEIIGIKRKLQYELDMEETIATMRYKFIEKVNKECISKMKFKESITDKLDKVFLNKWIAFPIFIVIMFLVYFLSVGVIGSYTVDYIANVIDFFGENALKILINNNISKWVISLVVDGIIEGVGAVIGFIPQLIILFFCISLLETTGYMARIALLLDKVFRKIGLSGKSLIPFILGLGCSVPGIMSSRIIENDDERKMTAILTTLVPCSAKLPIIVLFSSYFFPNSSGLVSVSLYFLSIIIIVVSAFIMKKFIFKSFNNTYVFELPEYKKPNLKYVFKDVLDKVLAFIKRAGSTIFLCSIVIWFLLSFSFDMKYGVDIENSILAEIGNKISFIFYPILGENSWEVAVSAIQGLVAKEQVVSSMNVINGFNNAIEEGKDLFIKGGSFEFFTASSAYAFMIFNLFSAPCFGAIGAMKREIGSIRKVLSVIFFQTAFAWILATITYQIGSRIESGLFNIGNILVIISIVGIIFVIINSKEKSFYCKSCMQYNWCKRKFED